MSPWRITPAGAPHAAMLAALHGASFADAWSAASLAALLLSQGVFALFAGTESAAGEDPVPLGFVLCRAVADECEVLTLAVQPQWRRRGIARSLLGAALSRAAEAGAAAVFLEVRADNHAACRLYTEFGFAPVGRRKSYYWSSSGHPVDALVLRRLLAPQMGWSC